MFRSPAEYTQWFESHLQTTGRDRTYREEALQHKGIFKQFYEELFPLYSLLKLKQKQWRKSRFRNVLGNQSYDVEVKGNALAYLEIATTDFDEGELFRWREFLANGYVSAIGRITRDNKGRMDRIEDEARPHNVLVQESVAAITARMNDKSAKSGYPRDTGLVVYYDDYKVRYEEEDYNLLRSTVEGLKCTWTTTFVSVFLVGPRGEVLIESKK